MKGRIILLVDDSEDVLSLLEEVFQEKGFTIMKATSGETALEIVMNDYIDVVLTDIIMPGNGGVSFIKNLMEIPTADRPILFTMSGFSNYADNELKEMGVKKCFEKPLDFDLVVKEICDAVKKIK